MNGPILQTGASDELIADALRVRRTVFIDEQGVAEEIEMDGRDRECVHAVLYSFGEPVACGRLVPIGKLSRIAVLRSRRRLGYGRKIVSALEAEAREQGLAEVALHAQRDSIPFYRELGYHPIGDIFEEAGIPHRSMAKQLS